MNKNHKFRSNQRFLQLKKAPNIFAIYIIITFSLWLLPIKANAQTIYPCLTNILNISTGVNHTTGNLCWQNEKDQYWAITMAPTNFTSYTLPVCATSWGVMPVPMGTLSTPISIVNAWQLSDANIKNNCGYYSVPYRFERKFKVDAITTGNITLNYQVNDYVQQCYLIDPQLNVTNFTSLACPNSISPFQPVTIPVNFIPGVYTLVFDVANLYLGTFGSNNPTEMIFELEGAVQTAIPALVDNLHFGRNTTDPMTGHVNYCSNPYPPSPYFQVIGNFCVNSLTDSTLLNISPYSNNAGQNIYSITGPTNPIINISGSFYAHPGSYTIHSQDAIGCAWDTTITVSLNPPFAITPPIQCVDTGSQGLVVFHTDTLIVNYGFQINGGPPVGFIDSNIYLNPGTYTVTCIDPFHGYCTSVDTVKIGKIPILTASVTPACIGVNDSSLIWAMAYPAPHVYHYDIFNPANILLDSITNNWIQHYTLPGDTGTYTIFVTDTVYGCADTLTVTVKSKPTPGLMLSTSKGCLQPFPNINTAIITATPTVAGSYLYQINGGTPQISNQFPINDTGAYYVNVIGTNGCSSVPEKIDIGNCLHCNPTQMNLFQSMQWYTNDTSSIDMGVASPTYPIVIDGTLTIDSNLNIFNNPNVYFTPFAKIEMVSNGVPQYLDIQNSTLKACYYHWTGIIADNPNENVNIDQSTLKNMRFQLGGNWYSGGVNMSNGAYLRSVNSNFVDNHIGINIKNVPYSYAGIIENNVFQSSSPTSLSFNGVTIINVKSMQVGGLINISQGNIFNNLMNGIEILRDKTITYSSTIGIFNNKFEDIRFPYYGIIPELLDSAIISASGTWQGAAIYASGSFDNLLTVNVDNTLADPQVKIINCDIGIGSLDANMNISNCVVENATLGIVGNSYRNVNYNIHDNFINRTHIGIGQYGNIATTQVLSNIINTRDTQMIATFTNAVTYKSPIGIDIIHGLYKYDPTGGFYNNIANNHIDLKAKAGIGINNQNSDRHQQILDNTVYLSNNSADPITASDVYACFGIVNMNAKKTSLKANYMYGSPSLQGFNSRNRIGLLMSYSPNNLLECNKVKYSRYGFYAWGDNTTSPDKIKFNKFNANAYPWYFLDFGSASPSTYGNVGDGLTDNGNEMISVANPINWLNTGGLNPGLFKVFRNSTSQPNYFIFTDPIKLDPLESGSSVFGNQYFVQVPANPSADPCADPFFIIGENDTTNNGIDSSELEQGLAVVQDSVTYINYPEVGAWFGKYRLFANLDTDSLLLNSTPEMLYFYTQQQGSTIGAINEADKKINILSDTTSNDSIFIARYNDALSANNSITSDNEWEMNEKNVNAIKLKIMSGVLDTLGYDTVYTDSLQYITIPITSAITAEEKDFLRELAHTCPFIGGNAVYKARTLWALFSPGTIYDDRLLCIMGQNKNADYSNINIDSLYESQIVENFKTKNLAINPPINTRHKELEDGEVLIYPNPASTQITVEYKCKTNGEFILYSSMGQIVLKVDLQNEKTKVSLLTNDLPQGVYAFKCIFAGCESKMGKLTIIK